MWSKDKIKAWCQSRLPPVIAEFVHRHLSRFTPDFWGWSIATFIVMFIAVALLAKIFLVGNSMIGHAVQTGQRVLIHVDSGEVEGNARHTKVAETNASTLETQASGGGKDGPAPAPFAAISAQTDKGLVPMIGQDGTLPWKYYARPYKGDAKRPLVAIVITHLGLSKPQTEDTFKLPHTVTLSFSPYASDARKWETAARDEGFETLVDLPMQSADYLRTGADPGPNGLLEDIAPKEASARLRWVLSRFPGFVGVLAPEDEVLTPNMAVMRPLLTELTGHGVLFLYLKTAKNTALEDMTKTHQSNAVGIDKIIDDDTGPGTIDKQLDELTALAKTQGYAIGFAHSYPPTLEALTRWSETLGEKGVDLAPISAIGMRIFP